MTITEVSIQSSTSSAELQNILENNNPFENHLFVKQHDIWEPVFLDLPRLNSVGSDEILRLMHRFKSEANTRGITITAEKGLGKSHFIRRIRQNLQQENGGFFVYMNEFTNLEKVKDEFFQALAYSMKQDGSSRFTQWQILATAMLNEACNQNFSVETLVEKIVPRQISECLKADRPPHTWIFSMCSRISQSKPQFNNSALIMAILWTLSLPHQKYVKDWLSGKEIEHDHAMGLSLPLSILEGRQDNFFMIAREILDLINEYAPILICFDELDSLTESGDPGLKPRIVSSLAKDIINNLKCGVVLTTMYPQTWVKHIKTMPQAEAVIDRIGQEIIDLEYLNTKNIVDFIEVWLKNFYLGHGTTPPSPIYPFRESELVLIGEERPTLREALSECKKLFKKKVIGGTSKDPVKLAYDEELRAVESSISEYMERKDIIDHALFLGFSSLVGQTVNGVEVRKIEHTNPKSPSDRGYINWTLLVKDGNLHKIGVSVIQEDGGNSLTASLKRLVDYEKFEISRGCLVRSKKLSGHAKTANGLVRQLIFDQKGEWVWLEEDHIKPLIALALIDDRKEDYVLTRDQIISFIRQNSIASNSPLLAEVLSKPSSKLPKNATISDVISKPSLEIDDPILQIVDPNDTRWISTIETLGDRSIETATGIKNSYEAGTAFELVVRKAMKFLGFTIQTEHRGGAGGLDFYCSEPFQLVGECKSGHSIPSGTVEQLIKLGGMHIGTDDVFKNSKKLIVGPGKPTTDVLTAAQNWRVSIITAKAFQALVMAFEKYPGAVTVVDFVDYLVPGIIDEKVDQFIKEKITAPMCKRLKVLRYLKSHLQAKNVDFVSTVDLWDAYRQSYPLDTITQNDFHLMLIELSSPLTRYVRREPGNSWLSDCFYFLRDLVI
jgi:hypothetical protein